MLVMNYWKKVKETRLALIVTIWLHFTKKIQKEPPPEKTVNPQPEETRADVDFGFVFRKYSTEKTLMGKQVNTQLQ